MYHYIQIISLLEIIKPHEPRPILSPIESSTHALLFSEQSHDLLIIFWLQIKLDIVQCFIDNFIIVRQAVYLGCLQIDEYVVARFDFFLHLVCLPTCTWLQAVGVRFRALAFAPEEMAAR